MKSLWSRDGVGAARSWRGGQREGGGERKEREKEEREGKGGGGGRQMNVEGTRWLCSGHKGSARVVLGIRLTLQRRG